MKSIKYILPIIPILFVLSCNPDIDNQQMIKKEVNNKIRFLINKKINKCRMNALEDAEIYVDSVISDITQSSLNNGIDFPDRPEKKDTDSLGFKIKIDSINLEEVIDSLKIKRDTVKQ